MQERTILSRDTLAPLSLVGVVAVAAWSWSARLTDIEHGVREVGAAATRIESRLADYVTAQGLRAWIAEARAQGAKLPEYR